MTEQRSYFPKPLPYPGEEPVDDEPKRYTNCLRCKRGLRNLASMVRGYGPVCWTKVQKENLR